jgi:cell division protease FtsH
MILLADSFTSFNIFLKILIFLAFFIFILKSLENFVFYFEKKWKSIIFQNLSQPGTEEQSPFDGFQDFSSLDESVFQVVTDINIKFDDVAGNEEAKLELEEVVRFLKDPTSFEVLGASVPKGVLLGGPPGTGKTLLAKAIAGESGTPFFRVSGSQFVELLVGVGAARVRELFEKARAMKPCIIFIDEIDAIARARSSNTGMGGGNDEREQTLNQILTELDGFQSNTGVVVLAATNRIDILDPAIKRAGRFDRQIIIGNPNLAERQAILRVHAKGKKFDAGFSIPQIAQRTIGFSGADLANLLNEAAILATRRKKAAISMEEVNSSIDRIIIGLERKQFLRIRSRQIIAFHEMGHAFIGTLISDKEGVEKISLIPRGNSQGITWTLPSQSQYTSREDFINKIFIAIAGRAAEEMIGGIGDCTAGAQQDIFQLTRILRAMTLRYAMVRLQELKQQAQKRNLFYLGTDVKQELNNVVDVFTTDFMDGIYNEVVSFLETIRPGGERLVDQLLIYEELSGQDLRTIAQEYVRDLDYSDVVYNSRDAALFEILDPDLKKSVQEVEAKANKILQKSLEVLKGEKLKSKKKKVNYAISQPIAKSRTIKPFKGNIDKPLKEFIKSLKK